MLILSIDTCLSACSAALVEDGAVRASRLEPMVRGHQERLATLVREVMDEAGAAFAEVDRLGVTVGPGSFTGLRVGLSFAKAMALALGKPCVGVGSLEALAASAPGPGLAAALVDARRGQAYWQAFVDAAPAGSPAAAGLDDISTWLAGRGGPARLIGPGAALLAERFPKAQVLSLPGPDPAAIAALAARAASPLTPPAPLYLRTPDAKLPGGIDPW